MQVQTYLFGNVDVSPEQVITFPKGLVGLENLKRFMLAHESEQGEPASFTLQSLDDPAIAFQIIDPVAVGFNYELALNDEENTLLGNPAPADIAVMLVLFKQEGEKSAIGANLRAPLLINTKTRTGLQKLMEKLQPNITLTNLSTAV